MLLFNSENHPDSSSGDLNGWNDHDNDIGFHGYSSENVWGDVEHPDESEDEVEEDDAVVDFFVAVDEFLSEITVFGVEESPVVPDVHVVSEWGRGEGC